MTISMIAAIGENRELGKDNGLLWHIPEDMQYFRKMTTGHVMIMGRRTFESFPKLLPNRVHIIVTRDKDYKIPAGCFVCTTIEEAIELGKKEEEKLREKDPSIPPEVYIIGGGQIFTLGMPYVDRLYLTFVEKTFPEADAFFPDYSVFKKVVSERKSSGNGYTYSFKILER